MKFSERLVVELKSSALTQKEIAEKLHIDAANITNWKKGTNIPSLEVFYELCKILDVSADYLLGLSD
jgi:transcriptional regulator with XRE-family HTH domain